MRGSAPGLLLALGALLASGCAAVDGDDGGGGAPGGPDAGEGTVPDDLDDPGGPPGELRWVYRHVLQVKHAPSIAPDGTIVLQGKNTFHTGEGGPTVLALDRRGELLWGAVTNPGAVPAPPVTIHGGEVLAPAAVSGSPLTGRLYRFDLASGNPLAPTELDGPITKGLAVGPDGTIYAPNTPLQAIRNGSVAWTYDMVGTGKTGSNAAVGPSGTVYVGARGLDDHNLHAVNPDGTVKWKHDLGNAVIRPIAIDDQERIYVLNSRGRLLAFEAGGEIAWEIQLDSNASGGGMVLGPDRTVYVGTIGRVPGVYTGEYLFAVRDGEIVWRKRVGLSWIGNTPALSEGGTLYVSDFCRALVAVRASDGEELWSYQIPEVQGDTCAGFSAPALGADGTVYVWNDGLPGGDGAGLYAFRGDGTGPARTAWPQEGSDAAHTGYVSTAPL